MDGPCKIQHHSHFRHFIRVHLDGAELNRPYGAIHLYSQRSVQQYENQCGNEKTEL